MKPFSTRCSTAARLRLGVLALALFGLPACGDDPFALRWRGNPQEVVLHSLARPELNTFSAYSLIDRIPLRVEAPNATGRWDLALDTRGGQLVFVPPGALDVFPPSGGPAPRILRIEGVTFEELTEAPGDTTLYSVDEPVPVATGSSYVIRTRQSRDRFGQLCVFYAKLEPLEVDPSLGTVRFVFDRNPICRDRSLVPDEPPEDSSS